MRESHQQALQSLEDRSHAADLIRYSGSSYLPHSLWASQEVYWVKCLALTPVATQSPVFPRVTKLPLCASGLLLSNCEREGSVLHWQIRYSLNAPEPTLWAFKKRPLLGQVTPCGSVICPSSAWVMRSRRLPKDVRKFT